jgi:hypothetical protein
MGDLGFMLLLTAALALAFAGSLGLCAVMLKIGDDPRTVARPILQRLALVIFLLPLFLFLTLVAVWACFFLGLSQTVICWVSVLPLIAFALVALASLLGTNSLSSSAKRRIRDKR